MRAVDEHFGGDALVDDGVRLVVLLVPPLARERLPVVGEGDRPVRLGDAGDVGLRDCVPYGAVVLGRVLAEDVVVGAGRAERACFARLVVHGGVEAERHHGRNLAILNFDAVPSAKAVHGKWTVDSSVRAGADYRMYIHHAYRFVSRCIVFGYRILHSWRVEVVGRGGVVQELADVNVLIFLRIVVFDLGKLERP